MRSRLTIRENNYTLSNAFKSMDSHMCTKIVFIGTFFSLKVLCDYVIASQTGTERFCHGDITIVIRVFHLYFTTVK